MAGVEERVDGLTVEVRQAADVSAAASRDAQVALAAHRRNTRLLNALRETQADHSRRFDVIHARLEGIDARLEGIDARLNRFDGTFGRLTVGMHTIESLLRRALDDAG